MTVEGPPPPDESRAEAVYALLLRARDWAGPRGEGYLLLLFSGPARSRWDRAWRWWARFRDDAAQIGCPLVLQLSSPLVTYPAGAAPPGPAPIILPPAQMPPVAPPPQMPPQQGFSMPQQFAQRPMGVASPPQSPMMRGPPAPSRPGTPPPPGGPVPVYGACRGMLLPPPPNQQHNQEQ